MAACCCRPAAAPVGGAPGRLRGLGSGERRRAETRVLGVYYLYATGYSPVYYTTIGLLVSFGPPRALLLMAAQALGFRSTGREHPLDSRPGPSGVGVAGSAWGYACGVGDDEVGFAASTNSGDKRRRGVHADSRQGRRWHRSRVVRSVEVVSGCTGRRRCGRTSRRGVSREQGLLLRQLLGPPWWSSCCSSSSAWVTGYLMPSKWWPVTDRNDFCKFGREKQAQK